MSDNTPQEPLKVPEHLKNQTAPPAGQTRENNTVFGANPGLTVEQIALKQQMAKLDDEIPDETIPLPSMGKIYPEGSPLHMSKTIDFKVMTAREEDILTNSSLIKKGTVVTELIKSCLTNKAIDVSEMIAGDRNALMVAIRVSGYGAELPIEIECGGCGMKREHPFSLDKLPIKTLDIDPVQEGQNLFKFQLPLCKRTVYFRFLTGKDEEEIDKTREQMAKHGFVQENNVTTRLKHTIVQIDGETSKAMIDRFVNRMRAGDSLALRKYMDRNSPGIKLKETVQCPACEHEEELVVPIGIEFFWPDR